MTAKATGAVWHESRSRGSDRLVLLALADQADDEGQGARMFQKTLATKCQMSERAVRDAIRRLERIGELETEHKAHGRLRRGNVYRIVLPSLTPADSAGVTEAESAGVHRQPPAAVSELKALDPEISVDTEISEARPQTLRVAIKNALAEAWQGSVSLTPDAWRRIERPASEILAFGVGDRTDVTPEDIPGGIAEFAELWRVLWPHTPCTPQSVAQRWGWFVSGEMHRAAAGRAAEDERRARWRRRMEAIGR